jgi:Uri superfamily endonuclease
MSPAQGAPLPHSPRPGRWYQDQDASKNELPGEGLPRYPGSYLLVVRLEHPAELRIGRLGTLGFPAGWHVYSGSARRGLAGRLRHHLQPDRPIHWHIDTLRRAGSVDQVWVVGFEQPRAECLERQRPEAQATEPGRVRPPVLGRHRAGTPHIGQRARMGPAEGSRLECALAESVARLPGARRWRRFGSSDCRCAGHLASFARPPRLDLVWPGLARAYPPG